MIKKLLKQRFKYFAFFYTFLRYRVGIVFSLSIIVGLLDGVGIALFIPLLENVSNPNPGQSYQSEKLGNFSYIIDFFSSLNLSINLQTVLIMLVIVFSIKGLFKFLEGYYNVHIRVLFVRILRYKMIDGLAQVRYQYFTGMDGGRIQNTLSGEVTKVVTGFQSFFSTAQLLVLIMVYISLAFITNPQFTILVVIGALITNLIFRSIYRLTKKYSRDISKQGHKLQGYLIQSVHYYKYLKASSLINKYFERLKKIVLNIESSQRKMGILNSIMVAAREPLVILVVASVIIIQVNFLMGQLATIILSLLFFYRSLQSLVAVQSTWNMFLSNSGPIDNAIEFIDDLKKGKGENNKGDEFENFCSSIEIKNLSFSYSNENQTLDNINLSINKNETIAIVGESGSGKSTLLNIITGLIDTYQGEVFIDQKPYKDIKTSSIQNKIGYITQEPVIFNDTIFNNISFWDESNEISYSKFKFASSKSALTTFVNQQPEKENSQLGENGVLISGGQKQRISIARELYKNPLILVLDEATSSLDSETEKIIQENIEKLKGQYTIVMVAHRLSTIKNADKIVLLENGRIVGIDSFENLLISNEKFKKMVKLQEIF